MGWLIWKWNFYGALLPNTFYAKGKAFLLADGLQYLGLFGLSYLLVIPAIAIMVRLRQVLAGMTPWLAFGWALTSSWLLYLFAIGGDFMEFRLLVPILPALYLGIGHFLYVTLSDQWWRHAIWGLLLLANVAHGPTFGNWYSSWPMMPIIATRSTEKAGFMSYAAQGQAIRQRIGQAAHLRMAIGGAGAFPYYARYPFTDLFGLTDPITAQTGIQVDWAPGHIKLATLSHLNAEGVNLIILRCDPISKPYPSTILDGSQIILQAMLDHEPNKWNLAQLRFLQIPLNHQFYLSCIYLQAHPRLDTLIQTGEIQEITQRL
ncbi:MAG TPA: hypothetical protein ENJ82_05765 [Bacteroidetes bacterium]|nr:hypothetical protein [Bacteroidota bacterium]